jgi:Ca2+-binding EF-hand superfamily protein
MRIPKIVIPAAVLLTLAAPAVHAQKSGKKPAGSQAQKPQAARRDASPSPLLAEMDADHDGKITRAEWKGNAIGFAMLDRNGDGVLSGDELRPADHPPAPDAAAEAFARLDRDHDGRLTRAEWQGDAKDFALLDRDHDGVVTREEYLQRRR